MPHVVIVGAGITGLTTAWWLQKRDVSVTVLEKENAAGGTMRTHMIDGWLVETGPTSALETTPLFSEMFEHLGILEERVYANAVSDRRYILRAGKLHPLPMSPLAFLGTSLWTLQGKLRLLREPFIPATEKEETIAEFVERRLGREFLDYAVNPFVAGVYAGNPEHLSVRAAFPKLYALEAKYGGLIKGMIKGRKERKRRSEKAKDRARMFSFMHGMETFPNALARSLGNNLRVGCEIVSLNNSAVDGAGGWQTVVRRGDSNETIVSDAVVIAVPAFAAATLIKRHSEPLAERLRSVYYPPVAEVFLGFTKEQIGIPLDGFGYLIPQKEERKILGTIWSSTVFPQRAPAGHVALTTFVGGSRQPELLDCDDEALKTIVLDELQSLMRVSGQPVFSRIIRWEKAIPQYNRGYHTTLEAIEGFEKARPGLFLCGNYRGGIAVGDCVMSGKRTADVITDYLNTVRTNVRGALQRETTTTV
jgi:oxygen-dependent protoporphyrinogen oxidase